MRTRFLFLILLLGLNCIGFSQSPNLGNPIIQSFPKEISKSASINWDIDQDIRGVMYFANDLGLLSYDGSIWKIYPLPNKTNVRSIEIAANGAIYAGGQNEFGQFIPNGNGDWQFESLRYLFNEKDRNFEDVWEIILPQEDQLLFRASGKIYSLQNEKGTIIAHDKNFDFLGGFDDRIWVKEVKGGFYEIIENQPQLIPGSELFNNKLITSLCSYGDQIIIGTEKNGLYAIVNGSIEKWNTDADEFLQSQHVVSLNKVIGNQLAVGTDFGGLVIFDKKGNSQYLINRQSGLINNAILSLFEDQSHNLWLGLRNGLSYIELNSPFRMVYPDDQREGTGYAVQIHNEKIYFGTNKGLYAQDWKAYYSPFASNKFNMLESTKGQVWGLNVVDDELLLGHTKGGFRILGNKALPVNEDQGVWLFDSLKAAPNYMISGNYSDISLYQKKNDWEFERNLGILKESCRFVEQDNNGNIWVAHPYRGVFKIELKDNTPSITKYGQENGLPSDNQNHLFKVKDAIIFCGERGSFLFDYKKEEFQPYGAFDALFGEKTKIRRLFEAPNGDIWFITNNELGVLEIKDRGLDKSVEKKVFSQFANQLNAGFEFIYPFDEDNVFISNDRGFIHYSPKEYLNERDSFPLVINEVSITAGTDSLLYSGVNWNNDHLVKQQTKALIPNVPYTLNAFHFRFSMPVFQKNKKAAYRYYLEGTEDDWSEWSNSTEKEYTNLRPGKYNFHLQSRIDEEGAIATINYRFVIQPPWYATNLAYLIYGILGILFFGSVIRKFQKKYYGLKEETEQTIKKSELEIVKLREEKMNTELEYKKRELVTATLHLVKKNETINQIRERIREIKKKNQDGELNQDLQKLITMMEQEEIIDEGWEDLMLHFNQLHGDFFERLKSNFPDLTPKDLKMCAYLRMNLSTKELATLLNVTTRGVEASRYRLRKKLSLNKEHNLTEFMMRY